jgi:hypothetical protein
MEIMSEHRETLLRMIAFCAGVDRQWMEDLSDSDGRTLMMVFWRVNRSFFFRRLSLARALAPKPASSVGGTSVRH